MTIVGYLKDRKVWAFMSAQTLAAAILGCAFFLVGFSFTDYLITTAVLVLAAWAVLWAHIGVYEWVSRRS
ncbi:hypothetical protein K3M35_05365 [Rhodococcus sp. DMU2021]|uniref:hypothetical protein n=1 Tax=Rhodococcus sp. DMU2021 TaxID=2866997 RepID=UPI001C7D1B53|nr:hypothetical protein [Rhodococcus sp. DMU2021]MBX4168096.1 hypothetical protein [Rhodococcus sp. DMU2021]